MGRAKCHELRGMSVIIGPRDDFLRNPADVLMRSLGVRPIPNAPVPSRNRLYADMASLFRQDLANVEAGVYPLPADGDSSLPMLLDRSRLFFVDLPEIHCRRERGQHH